jgi:hypothetical protein
MLARDKVDEYVVTVAREIMPDCVLSVVRGLYPNPPSQPYMGHNGCDIILVCVTITFIDDSCAFSFVLILSHISVIIF